MKALLFIVAFIAIYALADWLGGVVAPVLGPLFLASLVMGAVYMIYRLMKAGA